MKAETPDGIVLEFPSGWEQSGQPSRPYFVKETNALQVELVPELSPEDQQLTEEGLVKRA